MITVYIALVTIACYIIYARARRNLPPGPLALPILGYLPFLDATAPYLTLTNLAKKYGPIYGLKLGSIYTLVLADANMIRDALKRDIFTGRAPLFVTHGIMGGYGLICSEGELWKDQRKLSIEWMKRLGGAKHSSNRHRMADRIMVGVNEFIDTINNILDTTNRIDPTRALYHTLGNVINDIVFGVTYAPDDPTWLYLQQLQEEGVRHIGISGVINFIPSLRYVHQLAQLLIDPKEIV